MQLSSDVRIPDGLLAANALLAENSHQGFGAGTHTLHQGFGVVISHTALGISGTLYDGRIGCRYTAKERDSESGLDYFGARFYSNAHGRWFSPDWADKPISVPYAEFGDPQSLNLYDYVRNNPMSKADADGHQALVQDLTDVLRVPAFGAVGGGIVSQFVTKVPVVAAGLAVAASGGLLFKRSADALVSNAQGKEQLAATESIVHAENSERIKDVYLDPAKHPATAGHAADAQAAGHPDVLTVDRIGSDPRRAASVAGVPVAAGTDRDEYPPAVTVEGGKGSSVRNVSSSDNRGAGASLGQQIRDVPNGGKIRIKIGSPDKEK